MTTADAGRPDSDRRDAALSKVAAVVVLGTVMAVLDTRS
jgi:hypothetical protein